MTDERGKGREREERRDGEGKGKEGRREERRGMERREERRGKEMRGERREMKRRDEEKMRRGKGRPWPCRYDTKNAISGCVHILEELASLLGLIRAVSVMPENSRITL